MSHSQGIGTNTICPICGNNFSCHTRGKPKTYCSDDCRNIFKYINALERLVLKVNFNGKSSNHLKADLFQLANKLKCN